MPHVDPRAAVAAAFRLGLALIIITPLLWVNAVLALNPLWSALAAIAALLTAPGDEAWRLLLRRPARPWRAIAWGLLIVIGTLSARPGGPGSSAAILLFIMTMAALYAGRMATGLPDAPAKIGVLVFSSIISLFAVNFAAGIILDGLETAAAGAAPQPGSPPAAAAQGTPPPTPLDQPTAAPTNTVTPQATPTAGPMAPPQAQRPIPGFGYVDYLEDNGQAEWAHLTGYGPRVDSVAHAYMLDADGNLIYDTIAEFNGKGYRGPEVPYDKPENVYRILIIGDSFVEALQVDYQETFYALLQEELARYNTEDRVYEVIALGRTGWGTLQETIYYQAEGYKYHADLVVLLFFINDVADNYPAFFYPNINNTNFDYIFEGESVRLVDTNREAIPPNTVRRLYSALPDALQASSLARLLVRLYDPPPAIRTPGGVLDRVHPQFYIYVAEPEVEGYGEAWERTGRGLRLFADAVTENGARFAVVPIFLGAEMVRNVAGWWPDLVAGWAWDDGLPERRLAEILAGQPAELLPTRPLFEDYARRAGGEVYDLLYLPEDGHFNRTGHELTKDTLLGWLVEQGIVGAPAPP